MHKSCVHELPNETHLKMEEIEAKAALCAFPAFPSAPQAQVYAMDTVLQVPNGGLINQNNCSWNVPPLPATMGSQVVYFWPGFKSGQPVMGYPVLQPVLQYGQHGKFWELQSWFVWGNKGVSFTGPAIPVSNGDMLDSYMQIDSSKTWTVYGIDRKTGQSSTLHVTNTQVGGSDFPYNMLVLETIMPTEACGYYPAGGSTGVTFTNNIMNNAPVASTAWTPQVTMTQCQQKIMIASSGNVQFTWSN
jgi:hypothetical protein